MPVIAILVAVLAALFASWFLATKTWANLILCMLRRRSGLTTLSISIGGVRWRYLAGGHGPTLLLLHGFGGDAHNWLDLARQLRHRFTLVIPDLPGFGESAPPQNLRFDMDSQVDRLEQFVDSLDIGACFVVGNSMGGYLATAFASRKPQRVIGLWLIAPLGVRAVEPGTILQRIDRGDLDYLQITSLADYKANTIAHMFYRTPWIPGPLLRALAHRAKSLHSDAARMLHEVRSESEPLESLAKDVNHAVLLQWGGRDQVTNPAGLPILADAFKNAEPELTPDCGHLPMVECAEASAKLFVDFYERRFGS